MDSELGVIYPEDAIEEAGEVSVVLVDSSDISIVRPLVNDDGVVKHGEGRPFELRDVA